MGDLYQYPPVYATVLYTPTPTYAKKFHTQLAKCLDCLAWKSVNAVVTLIEQVCMKTNVEYATTVTYEPMNAH